MRTRKVILVVGASSGIGQTVATRLAAAGHRVFGTSRRPDPAQAAGFTLLPLDIRSPESIRAAIAQVVAQVGRLDVLINCAGYLGPIAASEETALERSRALFETNFFGAVALTNAVLPVMRQQGGGQLIYVSSISGVSGCVPFFSFYGASKHALEGYAEALAYEVRPFDLRVTLVEPGWCRTAIAETMEPPDQPLVEYAAARQHVADVNRYSIRHGCQPEQVARLIQRIVACPRPRLRYRLGLEAHLIWLGDRLLPAPVMSAIVRWMLLGGAPRTETDRRPVERRLGLRRYFFDSRAAERAARIGGLALVAALGLLMVRRRTRTMKGDVRRET